MRFECTPLFRCTRALRLPHRGTWKASVIDLILWLDNSHEAYRSRRFLRSPTNISDAKILFTSVMRRLMDRRDAEYW